MIPAPPPALAFLPAGTQLIAGTGRSTVLPDLDFETYSEAGFVWDIALGRWQSPPGNAPQNNGLGAVGAAVYSEHPSTEVLSLSYDLKDGRGVRRWRPGSPAPIRLLIHVATGGLLEAWNAGFEWWIWNNVCAARYGWPPLPAAQLRCAMAKARAHALPGALDNAGHVLKLTNLKDADGKRLLTKFSRPRNPTKGDPRLRIRPDEDPTDAARLYAYNDRDIEAEAEASSLTPDLPPDELTFWQADQIINHRGVAVDRVAIETCAAIVEQAHARYNAELCALTGGAVEQASQLERIKEWLVPRGVYMFTMDEDAITETLRRTDLDPGARRALEIRALVGSASVKKLYAMRNQATRAGRLHDLFSYHATRTGRATGNGPQPHNLYKGGPSVSRCPTCTRWSNAGPLCPWCGHVVAPPVEWSAAAVDDALTVISTGSLDCVELFFGNAIELVSGCLRGLFVAADGHDLVASDYNAIEAVVLAALAGEEWRLEVFRTHGKIYEASAAAITGIPFEEFARYRAATGQHRPERAKIGKVAELASGYQGWIGAWKAFGADAFFSDEEIKGHILAWRAASPAIVEFWGGQYRGRPWDHDYRAELFGLEGAAIAAVQNPGQEFTVHAAHPDSRPVTYFTRGDVLYCRLPSGRLLTYHEPRLAPSTRGIHRDALSLSFMGWNTNPKMGAVGWVRIETYGGKQAENVVQAVARDMLRDAIVRLETAGYSVVLHVHDEPVAEVPAGWGSVEEFESTMVTHAPWAAGWPVKASGGWRGRRYRKD